MNVLVTGGTGFIGSYLVNKLIKLGHIVFILNKSDVEKKNQDNRINWIDYDGTYESITNGVENQKIDVVFHLATMFVAKHSPNMIPDLINANITLGVQLLEFMKNNEIKFFINTSTYAQSIDNELYNPQNLYSATKKAFEDILQYYINEKTIRSVTLTLYDTYGPKDTRPKFINLVIDAYEKNEVFNMSLGEQEICYVHVYDVIDAYLQAMELLIENKIAQNKTYNVYGNEVMNLNELVLKIGDILDKPSLKTNPGYYKYREREIMKFIPKFEKIPGWEPKYNLREGIESIIKESENENIKN